MAALESLTLRYGVTACRRCGMKSVVAVMRAPSLGDSLVVGSAGSCRARSSRRRSSAVNAERGAMGGVGSRGSRKGSGIVASRLVRPPERGPGPHEQRLGGVDGPVELLGHLGDRQAVEVAERERGP